MIRADVNLIKEDCGLFLEFAMASAQMDPKDQKISILAMEVEPVTVTDPKFWKWADHRLDAALATGPIRSVVTRGSGTSHIYHSF